METKKRQLKPFAISGGGLFFGEVFKAETVQSLLETLPKRWLKMWEVIQFVDDEDRNITVTREFIETQGMTIAECVADWIENGNTKDEITALNPKGRGLIRLDKFTYKVIQG